MLATTVSGHPIKCKLYDVLFVTELTYELVSLGDMKSTGHSVAFDGNKYRIEKGDKTIAEGGLCNGLITHITKPEICCDAGSITLIAETLVWHRLLAHVHCRCIRSMGQN